MNNEQVQERVAELTRLVELGQSQLSLTDQLWELQRVANLVGLYDAADYIQRRLNEPAFKSSL